MRLLSSCDPLNSDTLPGNVRRKLHAINPSHVLHSAIDRNNDRLACALIERDEERPSYLGLLEGIPPSRPVHSRYGFSVAMQPRSLTRPLHSHNLDHFVSYAQQAKVCAHAVLPVCFAVGSPNNS